MAQEHADVFIDQPGAVIGSQNHACFGAQSCFGKRPNDHTVRIDASRRRLREDGNPDMVRDQVHCLGRSRGRDDCRESSKALLGNVDEVAGILLWPCSSASNFNTGAAFDMSGGRARY